MARDLLGKLLAVQDGAAGRLVGRIVEVEAYLGRDDPASHAYRGPTPRAAIMYGPPGRLYVYFTYGAHHCMNFVTEEDGVAGAVLIRAVEPLAGLAAMAGRRGVADPHQLASGPGKLTQALGIDLRWNGLPLTRGGITVRDAPRLRDDAVAIATRVGIRVATDRPLRFAVRDNPHVSRPWPWATSPGATQPASAIRKPRRFAASTSRAS